MKHEKKKRVHNAPIVDSVIKAYRETGAETDPMGMYTGVVEELKPMGAVCAACPDTKTPTDAILEGKTYRSKAALENSKEVSYAEAQPQQDADDL